MTSRRRAAPAALTRPRLLAVLAALLLHVTGLGHMVLVRHDHCEHGELVHVAPSDDRPGSPSDRAAADPGTDDDRSGHDPGSDDHCDALAIRALPAGVAPCVAPAALLAFARPAAAGPGAEARPIPLLRLAPKSSPPAA